MPLLEYRCAGCGRTAEFLVLAGDRATAPVCPHCGSRKMSRLLSTFAAQTSRERPDAETMCGDGPCATPGVCGPSACNFGED